MALPHFEYDVFSLRLKSNSEIPGLSLAHSNSAAIDLQVFWGVPPPSPQIKLPAARELLFASASKSDEGEPVLKIWRNESTDHTELEYCDGMLFWVDRDGKNVWCAWPEGSSLEDAATYFLGPVFGLILRLRGFACLHASAVRIGDLAVAFVGPEGAGKSTTAAAFAKQGYTVISDDVVALSEKDGRFYVLPAYPYLSLWPDSVHMVYGRGTQLPSFSKTFEKKMLRSGAHGFVFEREPIALGAIVILGERLSSDDAPRLEVLTSQEALVRLVANSYAVHLVGKEAHANEFAAFGKLASLFQIAALRPHTDPTRLPQICTLVSAWLSR